MRSLAKIAKSLRDLAKDPDELLEDLEEDATEVEEYDLPTKLWNLGDNFEDSLAPSPYSSSGLGLGYRGPHNDRNRRRVIRNPTLIFKAPRAVPR